MANWTVATMFERLSEVLEEENMVTEPLLDADPTELGALSMATVVEVLKDRIVRDQFTPKAKAQARKKTEAKPDAT